MNGYLPLPLRIQCLSADLGELKPELQSLWRASDSPDLMIAAISRPGVKLMKRIFDAVGMRCPSDNLFDCIETAYRERLLPAEYNSALHLIRVWSNKKDHDGDAAPATQGDVSFVIEGLLSVTQWFFTVFDRGPRLASIFDDAQISCLTALEFADWLHGVPAPLTACIGRDTQVWAWCELLRDATYRLVTLHGMGGIGKTRCAIEIARSCAQLCPDLLADGIWWVDLSGCRSAAEMRQAIISALHLEPRSTADTGQTLAAALAGKRLLLVLDNVETVGTGAQDEIVRMLSASAGLRILATSRVALSMVSERCCEVGSLATPAEDSPIALEELGRYPAIMLFANRVKARDGTFQLTDRNVATIARICQKLEGVPLALELAAAHADLMDPEEMLECLQERFEFLGAADADLPLRQRTLRATLDWSYNALDAGARQLLAELSVFAGPFGRADANAVGTDASGLGTLIRSAMVRPAPDSIPGTKRFCMYDSVREYAAARLAEQPEQERRACQAHARWCLTFATLQNRRIRTKDEPDAIAKLQEHLNDLKRAADHYPWEEPNVRATLALQLGHFLSRRGFFTEAEQRVAQGLEIAQRLAPPDPGLVADLLLERAGFWLDKQAWAQAAACAEEAMALAAIHSDPLRQARGRAFAGMAARGEGDLPRAHALLSAALEIFRREEARAFVPVALNNLGIVERFMCRVDAAEDRHRQAAELFTAGGDLRGQAEALNNLGMIAFDRGTGDPAEMARAWGYFFEAHEIERRLGNLAGIGRTLCNLGETAVKLGRPAEAARLFVAAERLLSRIGSPYADYAREQLQPLHGDTGTEIDAVRAAAGALPPDRISDWALGGIEEPAAQAKSEKETRS